MSAKQVWAAFASDSEIEIKRSEFSGLSATSCGEACHGLARPSRESQLTWHSAVSMTLACHPCAVNM